MEGIKAKTEMGVSDALATILECAQRAHQMGRQDFEPAAFEDIARKVQSGELSPLKGAEQAQALLESKQEY